jgi:hypothetical protein
VVWSIQVEIVLLLYTQICVRQDGPPEQTIRLIAITEFDSAGTADTMMASRQEPKKGGSNCGEGLRPDGLATWREQNVIALRKMRNPSTAHSITLMTLRDSRQAKKFDR